MKLISDRVNQQMYNRAFRREKRIGKVSLRLFLPALLLLSLAVGASANPTLNPTVANGYIWAVQFTGHSDIQGNSIAIGSAGNVYTLGEYQGTVDFDPDEDEEALFINRGNNDIFLSKLDEQGKYLWTKTMGGDNIDVGTALAIDGDENLYTTGHFRTTVDFDPSAAGVAELTSPGNDDIFIAKFDKEGKYLWANGFGDISSDRGLDIAVDGAGNVYATGYFSGTIDFDPGTGVANLTSRNSSPDVFIAKFDTNGAYLWAKKIGGSKIDQGNSITVDANGNIYVVGYFRNIATLDPNIAEPSIRSAGSHDIFVIKLTADGTLIWAHAIGSADSDVAKKVALGADGTVYIMGEFSDTVDFNPDDHEGEVANLVSSGNKDLFLLSLTPGGVFGWAQKFGGTGRDSGADLVVDADGTVQLLGIFEGTIALDDTMGEGASLVSAGDNDLFFASYSKAGVLKDAFRIGGTGADTAGGLAAGANESHYLTGAFVNTVDFDPDEGEAALVSRGEEDGFILKLAFVNTQPSAQDDSETVDQDSKDNVIDPLQNDSDPDVGQILLISSVGTPDSGGSAKISTGKILYTPAKGFVGTETFAYTISDGNGGSASATVTIIVQQTEFDTFLPYVSGG